jgi:hypothetical protein
MRSWFSCRENVRGCLTSLGVWQRSLSGGYQLFRVICCYTHVWAPRNRNSFPSRKHTFQKRNLSQLLARVSNPFLHIFFFWRGGLVSFFKLRLSEGPIIKPLDDNQMRMEISMKINRRPKYWEQICHIFHHKFQVDCYEIRTWTSMIRCNKLTPPPPPGHTNPKPLLYLPFDRCSQAFFIQFSL